MTTPAPLEQLGRLLALVLSGIVISVIAFFVLDEANARFGVMAASVVIVALTSPLARGRLGRWGQLLDVILIAGKGHEDYQILGKETIPFSDREKAEIALCKIMDMN